MAATTTKAPKKTGKGAIKLQDLEKTITKALKKVESKVEHEVCHYIPYVNGCRLHHLAYRRMKRSNPGELMGLINEHILKPEEVQKVPPQSRQKRAAKTRDRVVLARNDLDAVMEHLREAGEQELLAKLVVASETFSSVKRNMIKLIRAGEIDDELWETYKQAAKRAKTIDS